MYKNSKSQSMVFRTVNLSASLYLCSMKQDELFSMLDGRRRELGLSQADVGRAAFGNPKDTSLQNIRRGAVPSYDRLKAIAEALDLDFYIGPKLDRQAIFPRLEADEFTYVKRFDVKLSAGPGANGDNARQLAQVAFRQDWMLQQGLVADKCVVCNVCGQSMEPLLFDGDLVLIDQRKADLRDGQVYALVDIEGDVRIKRLETIEGGILLRSDNPSHLTELRLGEDANRINIIGKLAWSGHTHGTQPVKRNTK